MNTRDSQFFDKTNNEKFYFDEQRLFNFKYLSIVNSRNNILYQIVEQIGKGGNGVVYLVICLSGKYQGQLFALKLFQNIRKSERLHRFHKEIAIVKKLNHPSIIRHYDDGEFGVYDRKYPFLITSYIPDNLDNIIRKKSPLDFYEALIYSIQLLSALKECEEKGVIHRDIKPKNIFINNKTAILGDFGLMKLVNSEISEEEEFKEDTDSLCYGQALHYRCPDVIQYVLEGKSLTTKANIFSMGLVLAEMFGGKNPQKQQFYSSDTTPRERYTSPILWDHPKFGYIGPSEDEVENPKTYGDKILWILSLMLDQEPEKRPNAGKVLNELIPVFTRYIKDKSINPN